MEATPVSPAATSASDAKERFNNWVAIAVAMLAGFMAVTKVKDDNICQAMLQAKSDAVDTWSEYQAKRIKQHIAEVEREQIEFNQEGKGAEAVAMGEALKQKIDANLERYRDDETALKTKAEGFEARYDELNFRDDQFDLSDALLSVSVAMLAVSALVQKRWLLGMSLLFGSLGVLMGVAGLAGWHVHPDALTQLLS